MEETPQEALSKITAAREALKAQNDAYDAEKLRAERLRAEQILGGRGEIAPQIVEHVETPKEYAQKVLKGVIPDEKK